MGKNKITKAEVKRRIGYVLLGLFAYIFIEPIRGLIAETYNINGFSGVIVGIVGFFIVLYYFDF